jgi:hypothetical protein
MFFPLGRERGSVPHASGGNLLRVPAADARN